MLQEDSYLEDTTAILGVEDDLKDKEIRLTVAWTRKMQRAPSQPMSSPCRPPASGRRPPRMDALAKTWRAARRRRDSDFHMGRGVIEQEEEKASGGEGSAMPQTAA